MNSAPNSPIAFGAVSNKHFNTQKLKKMIKSNVLFILLFFTLFTACEKEQIITGDDEIRTSNLIRVNGNDIVLKGAIDGEEFVFQHENNAEYNVPSHSDTHPDWSYFGTSFMIKYPGQPTEALIKFGLTRNKEARFEDVVRVGTYNGWYGFTTNPSVGLVAVEGLEFRGESMTSAIWSNNNNADSYFTITSITPLEMDENFVDKYSGQLYRVEGRFATNLDKWDNSGDAPRLTIEYFSAIFYDNSL
jgi:hypothetical protein